MLVLIILSFPLSNPEVFTTSKSAETKHPPSIERLEGLHLDQERLKARETELNDMLNKTRSAGQKKPPQAKLATSSSTPIQPLLGSTQDEPDADLREFKVLKERMVVRAFYFDLREHLKLGEDSYEELLHLMAFSRVELSAAKAAEKEELKLQSEERIRDLLGEQTFSRWKTYLAQEGQRLHVWELGESLSQSGTPLSHEQRIGLGKLVNESWADAGNPHDKEVLRIGTDAMDQQIYSHANTVLTPDQMVVLLRTLNERALLRAVRQKEKSAPKN